MNCDTIVYKKAFIMISSRLFVHAIGLLMFAAVWVSVVTGQQGAVGVSLVLRGVTIPNNSLVDFDDTLYTGPSSDPAPTNANGLHDQTLVCVTDLVDCCESPPCGNWYHPDGGIVTTNPGTGIFRSNRGQNEMINERQFCGSVRIFKSYTPLSRGRFRCELPSAANPNVNLVLYANIVNFGADFRAPPATVSPTGSTGTAGETYSLMCSTTLHSDSTPLPSDVPSPTFEWFFGPNNSSLPSGVTPPATAFENGNTYTSTLQFPRLSESHAGMYTCRLGVGRLASNAMVIVNRPTITARITANLNEPLMVGQTDNNLACDVSGADNLNPMRAYQWTRNDGATLMQVGTDSTLTFSPLRLSNAGVYNCSVTVSSTLFNSPFPKPVSNFQTVTIQIPAPQSVTVTSILGIIVRNGSDVSINCTVQMNENVLASEVSLLMVTASLTRPNGTSMALDNLYLSGTTYSFGTRINRFGDSDVGNYTCRATVQPQQSATAYLMGMGQLVSDPVELMIGIPQPPTTVIGCSNEIAITVVATILIECLLAVPVVAAVVALCWKRSQRKPQYKSDTTAVQGGGVSEDVYEEPDKLGAITTTAPGNYELTECPAYVPTTMNQLQPVQSSDYEL